MLRRYVLVLSSVGVALTTIGVLALAGPLDPPAGAVTSSYRTLDQVAPTWDRVLPAAERFKLVMGGAGVLDLETGLVWEKSPDSTFSTLSSTLGYDKLIGGRKGWRMPSVEELMTLVDMSQPPPRLPAGHPFVASGPSGFQSFWTSTKAPFDATRVWQVDLTLGSPLTTTTINQGQTWLVRGGSYSAPRP